MINSDVINKAIDYIMIHLAEDIRVEDVAKHCHFSKYHFCRIFKASTGESVYAFIKRLKMDQSAFRLKVEKDKLITDVGFDFGYSPSNYSVVFKKHHQISPVEFRKEIATEPVQHPFLDKQVEFQTFEDYKRQVTIRVLEDFPVIYERYIGNYKELREQWATFIEKYKDYQTENTRYVERSYDDPTITVVDQCLYDICMTVDLPCDLENVCIIKGGKFAVYRFEGYINEIFQAFQGLFSIWLPDSGFEMDERYGLDIYQSIDCEKDYVVMDMCLPIK